MADAKHSRDLLKLDAPAETRRIEEFIRATVSRNFRRKGAIIAVSGGIDSSVVAALCVRALGKERVFGLMLPERESSDETRQLSRMLIEHLGIAYTQEDITPVLQAAGCYKRRDDAIRTVVPEYGEGYRCKIVLPSLVDTEQLRFFSAVVASPDGRESKARLTTEAYLGVVASTNFKQRVRKMLEYYHADRLAYAVAGTPNRLEYELGFFVKNGDGAADFKPIAHLYKSQVYQLAEYMGIPEAIRSRPPTTDTYSLPQTQEEFYFALPFDKMDLCLYGRDSGMPPAQLAPMLDLSAEQIERIYRDIDAKRNVTRYLLAQPAMVDEGSAAR
jgi:NAD+ synthase